MQFFAFDIDTEKGRCTEKQGTVVFCGEFTDTFGIGRVGLADEGYAFDQRCKGRDGQTE